MTKTGFEILTAQNTHEDLLKYREQGALRGKYLGFPIFHEHYSMAIPGCTDWTGFPASGKSEFLIEMLLNTSLFYGWKHLMYVPDVGDKNEIISIIIHKITGKTFDKRFKNYITEQDVSRELNWVLEHFKILTKVDLKAKISPYEFFDMAAEMKKEHGLHTATIDSWKDMKLNIGMDGEVFSRDDKYLDDVLSYRNAMAELHKLHFHIVIHPIKTEQDRDGKRRPPTPYDQKGGGTWFDNGKTMITAHRTDGSVNGVDIIINKAKPKSVAKLGTVKMFYDMTLSKFYWDYNGEKKYATEKYFKPTGLAIFDEQNESEESESDIPF